MVKTLFHRSERDVTFEIHDTSKYIKVTVSNILEVESTFYISEEFIEELACEIDRAKRDRRILALNIKLEKDKGRIL